MSKQWDGRTNGQTDGRPKEEKANEKRSERTNKNVPNRTNARKPRERSRERSSERRPHKRMSKRTNEGTDEGCIQASECAKRRKYERASEQTGVAMRMISTVPPRESGRWRWRCRAHLHLVATVRGKAGVYRGSGHAHGRVRHLQRRLRTTAA